LIIYLSNLRLANYEIPTIVEGSHCHLQIIGPWPFMFSSKVSGVKTQGSLLAIYNLYHRIIRLKFFELLNIAEIPGWITSPEITLILLIHNKCDKSPLERSFRMRLRYPVWLKNFHCRIALHLKEKFNPGKTNCFDFHICGCLYRLLYHLSTFLKSYSPRLSGRSFTCSFDPFVPFTYAKESQNLKVEHQKSEDFSICRLLTIEMITYKKSPGYWWPGSNKRVQKNTENKQ